MTKRNILVLLIVAVCAAGMVLAANLVPATPVSVSWDQYATHESSSIPHAYIEYRLVESPPASPAVVCAEQEVDTGLDAFDEPGSDPIPVPSPEPWDLDTSACYGLLEEQTRLVWRTEGEPPIYGIPLPEQVDRGDGWIFQQLIEHQDDPLAGLAAVNDSPTALGSPTTLTATISAGSNVVYTWDLGDGQSASGSVVAHIYPSAGVYIALVTATNSVSLLTDTTTVTIADEPLAGLAAVNDSPTSLGSPTTLTATISAGSSVVYTWDLDDGQSASGPVVAHIYPSAGVYTALVTATNSVSLLTDTTTVIITDEPLAGLQVINDSPTDLGNPTTLTATVSAGSSVVYTWDLGDGQSASGPVVAHIYPSASIYTALVTATNSVSLLTATTSVSIISSDPYFYLPLTLRAGP